MTPKPERVTAVEMHEQLKVAVAKWNEALAMAEDDPRTMELASEGWIIVRRLARAELRADLRAVS